MTDLAIKLRKLYALYGTIFGSLQSLFLLLVRLYWGWQFWQTGWGKLGRIPGVTEYFAGMGIPFPHANAVFVSWLEFVGGYLLFFGLASRLIALPLAIDMIVAYWYGDHAALLQIHSNPGNFYAAAPYTFLFASLMILIFGPGRFSLDWLIGHLWPRDSQARAH